jgi:hypothetical protein
VTIQTRVPSTPPAPLDEEALFREARRLRRRRWARGLLIAILLGGIAALAVLGSSRGDPAMTAAGIGTAGVLPNGPPAALTLAGPLAVSGDGALYVADVARDRVLVRVGDGRFRVVAGSGTAGFSGDGGPAARATLADISDLAFAPDGALYIADSGRVRVVSRDGVIHTIAGDGRAPRMITITREGRVPKRIANGTSALSASLGSTHSLARTGPLSIAFSPSGQLYISTGSQILRLMATDKLAPVRIIVKTGPLKGRALYGDFGPIAVAAHGNIEVAGFNGWAIWQIAPSGVAHEIGYARRSGGGYAVMQPGPERAIYGELGDGIRRIEPHKLVPAFAFNGHIRNEYFSLTYFAFSPSGTIYADDLPGDEGFEVHQQLLSVKNHHISLLWRQRNARPK